MKLPFIILLATVDLCCANPTSVTIRTPPEQQLADLQLEKCQLELRYLDSNPILQGVQSQIAALEKIPNIKNEKYFSCLKSTLPYLKQARETLLKKYTDNNNLIAPFDAKIAFIEHALLVNRQ